MVTTYFRNLVADNVWHTAGATALPETYWLALSSTEPLVDGTGITEPAAETGYRRVEVVNLSVAEDGVVSNEQSLSWPDILQDAGVATYWALCDAQTDGNVLMGGALDGTKHLDIGTSLSVATGGLKLNVLGA